MLYVAACRHYVNIVVRNSRPLRGEYWEYLANNAVWCKKAAFYALKKVFCSIGFSAILKPMNESYPSSEALSESRPDEAGEAPPSPFSPAETTHGMGLRAARERA
jgi:hypothetical protein